MEQNRVLAAVLQLNHCAPMYKKVQIKTQNGLNELPVGITMSPTEMATNEPILSQSVFFLLKNALLPSQQDHFNAK